MKSTALGGAALVIATEHPAVLASTPKAGNATMMGVPFETKDRVRLGIIGVGGRGTSLLNDLLGVEKVDVKAICDLARKKSRTPRRPLRTQASRNPRASAKANTISKI